MQHLGVLNSAEILFRQHYNLLDDRFPISLTRDGEYRVIARSIFYPSACLRPNRKNVVRGIICYFL